MKENATQKLLRTLGGVYIETEQYNQETLGHYFRLTWVHLYLIGFFISITSYKTQNILLFSALAWIIYEGFCIYQNKKRCDE